MKVVATEKAPKALGPYSQGYVHGGMFYSAGQIPINPAVDAVEAETIEEQTEQVCKNLAAVLVLHQPRRLRPHDDRGGALRDWRASVMSWKRRGNWWKRSRSDDD